MKTITKNESSFIYKNYRLISNKYFRNLTKENELTFKNQRNSLKIL